jgi:hypothetical protein
MSAEDDTFWISVGEKFFGLLLVIVGAIFIYYTVTSTSLGGFAVLFGFFAVVVLLIGIALLVVRPPE